MGLSLHTVTARDEKLAEAGVNVIRISAREIRSGTGPGLAAVREILMGDLGRIAVDSNVVDIVRWSKWLHECEVAAVEAVRRGWLSVDGSPWRVGVFLPDALRAHAGRATLVQAALDHLRELFIRVARIHGTPLPIPKVQSQILATDSADQVDVVIAPGDRTETSTVFSPATMLVSDVHIPREFAAPLTPSTPVACDSPEEEDARWLLLYIFRKPSFREGQWETIRRTLQAKDSVVLLPTGAGKSIAFQLAALLLPGRCIVVDPILSLVEDQIQNLSGYGIDRCIGITSQLTGDDRHDALRAFASGNYLFCYLAPERFQIRGFRDTLRELTVNIPISAIVVDEAHCVSEWGHDFRTAYLNIGRITREYCESGGTIPPLVALTGTASRIVLKDVQRELGITAFDAIITPRTFDRSELSFSVLRCLSQEKKQRLSGFLAGLPARLGATTADFFRPQGRSSHCGLVFCPHVNGEFGVLEQAAHLRSNVPAQIDIYSGGPPKGVSKADWERRKREATAFFRQNRSTVLVCTQAFGMGIDKPNIRYSARP